MPRKKPKPKRRIYQDSAAEKEMGSIGGTKNPYADNPKDIASLDKVPLDVVPDSMVLLASLALAEGKMKYGQFNWRAKNVRMSVYIAALRRHLIRMNSGEMIDPETCVPHIASILACAAIIGDAMIEKRLVFDRPPLARQLLMFMDDIPATVKVLHGLYGHMEPIQYTEQNSPGSDTDTK